MLVISELLGCGMPGKAASFPPCYDASISLAPIPPWSHSATQIVKIQPWLPPCTGLMSAVADFVFL
ncbi:hypothetical protein PspLS_11898 [Pyricularia sp. CBS 133598]|nr:hypothetical protein PspLS_11898 [Pyricularia sp. CBS 133598]